MADALRTRTELLSIFADQTTGAISPQDERDFIVSVLGVLPIVTKSSGGSYTATLDDCVIVVSQAADFTINLPAAATAGWTGKVLYIKKISADDYTVTVDPNASETIDGNTTRGMIAQYSSMTLICDGSNWHII